MFKLVKEIAPLRLTILPLCIAISVAGAQQTFSTKPARTSPWFDSKALDFVALTPAPPASGSKLDRQDLRDVLSAQRTRTAAQVMQAQKDDKEEDIFIFALILGPKFNATELPLTAALSQHLRDASSVINPPLKLRFGRPRPFVASTQVHPVCEKTATNSFPSGHGMVGTLEALALTQMVPEHSSEILLRLEQYMHNRIVCGVHYPSDEVASRVLASSLFGLIAASPAFQQELTAAKVEVRNHLGSSASPALAQDHLASNTVLIVRHAEKPLVGKELTPAGEARARAYARYFEPFREEGLNIKVDALYAGADSESSIRPRLTLEPLSMETGLKLDTTVSTKDPAALVNLLRTRPHGSHPLIAWRHGQIPALLQAFGSSASLIPEGKWPDDIFDWVVILHFDREGHISSEKLIREHLVVTNSTTPNAYK